MNTRCRLTLTALLAVLCALSAAAPASAAKHLWRVSGSIQGDYSNSVTWNNCGNVSVVNSNSQFKTDATATLTPRYTAELSPSGMSPRFKLAVSGSWTLSGSYAPRNQSVLGEPECGAPTPIQCSGKVVPGVGAPAKLVLESAGRNFAGRFIYFPGLTEDVTVTPPSDYLSICQPDSGAPLLVMPMWGLIKTEIETDAYLATVKIAKSKLRGKRSFSVTLPKSKPHGCSTFYASCTETGGFQMTLKFKPVRKK